MKSLNIEKYIQKYMFDSTDKSKILQFIKYIESHCEELEKGILEQDEPIAKKLLYEYIHITTTIYENIGLLTIIYGDVDYLNDANKTIEQMYNKFFTNSKIYEKVLSLKKVSEKIIRKFNLEKNPAINEITNNIKKLELLIAKTLTASTTMPTSKKMRDEIEDLPKKIKLDRQNYYFLQRNLSCAREREVVEQLYFSHSNQTLNMLANLVIERHKLAVLTGSPTYFNFIKKKTSNETNIKQDLEDLVLKIDLKSRKEIDRIYRNLLTDRYDKKVDSNDIVYYCEKFKTKITFSPKHILNCIFKIVEQTFGIKFIETQIPKLWSNTVLGYKVGFEKELLGHCYLDLCKTPTKTMTSPICLHMSHQYTNLDGNTTSTKVAIIGNYLNLDEKCMSFSDVIYLFKEFGSAIQMLSYKSSNGLMFTNKEFSTLMPQIMECILWERKTIEMLCKGEDSDIVDNVLFTRHLNFAHSIKIKCANALFDHVLHNSAELIKIIKSVDPTEYGQVLLSAYKKIYENIMFSQQDILNTNINGIYPTCIQQEINGSEGLVYCDIYTEILSFNIYQLTKSGLGTKFIKNVLRCDQNRIKTQLEEFITSAGDNSYDVYLRELIGYNEIDTEINNKINQKILINNSKFSNYNRRQVNTLPTIVESSANQFDDSDHSDDNVENIIKIDRKG